jgi:hypothetical protein
MLGRAAGRRLDISHQAAGLALVVWHAGWLACATLEAPSATSAGIDSFTASAAASAAVATASPAGSPPSREGGMHHLAAASLHAGRNFTEPQRLPTTLAFPVPACPPVEAAAALAASTVACPAAVTTSAAPSAIFLPPSAADGASCWWGAASPCAAAWAGNSTGILNWRCAQSKHCRLRQHTANTQRLAPVAARPTWRPPSSRLPSAPAPAAAKHTAYSMQHLDWLPVFDTRDLSQRAAGREGSSSTSAGTSSSAVRLRLAAGSPAGGAMAACFSPGLQGMSHAVTVHDAAACASISLPRPGVAGASRGSKRRGCWIAPGHVGGRFHDCAAELSKPCVTGLPCCSRCLCRAPTPMLPAATCSAAAAGSGATPVGGSSVGPASHFSHHPPAAHDGTKATAEQCAW